MVNIEKREFKVADEYVYNRSGRCAGCFRICGGISSF